MKKRLWSVFITIALILCACGQGATSNNASTGDNAKVEDNTENGPAETPEAETVNAAAQEQENDASAYRFTVEDATIVLPNDYGYEDYSTDSIKSYVLYLLPDKSLADYLMVYYYKDAVNGQVTAEQSIDATNTAFPAWKDFFMEQTYPGSELIMEEPYSKNGEPAYHFVFDSTAQGLECRYDSYLIMANQHDLLTVMEVHVKDSQNDFSDQYLEIIQNIETAGIHDDVSSAAPENDSSIMQVDWDKIADRKTISIKPRCFVGINDDGTVSATGINDAGECDIDDWEDIISVEAGGFHTVGLKSDGTVVATVPGNDTYKVSNVGDWKNIVAIAAGSSLTVGLRDDGTVVATGRNEDGECNVSSWRDIIAIAVGYHRTIGLRIDGTVVATGENKYGECDVSGWTDIVAIYAGERQTIGIKEDGTVVTTGDYSEESCDVSDWTDIIAVAPGRTAETNMLNPSHNYIIGLRADGTVVATGYGQYGQCDVSDWTDIVALTADFDQTIGLKSDGSIEWIGREFKFFDADDWSGIRVPDTIDQFEARKELVAANKNALKAEDTNKEDQTAEKPTEKTEVFTNKYGTPTTKCVHPGCNNYIAPSGDTNCCVTHSNRCADCGKYIDEDAMYCMDCLTKAAEGSNSGNQSNTDDTPSKKNSKKCAFLENGVEVCNNQAEEGSPYCSYHKKLLDDAYNSLIGK